MGYFDGLGDFNNSFGAQPTSSNTTNGNSAKWQTGDSYSEQSGNANSRQFGNKNSFQRGWSNSLLEGVSFSTNLAATFSQLVGVGFSTQTAGSVSVFGGPKFSLNRSWELSASWAAKYTWVKSETEYEVKEGSFEVTDKKAKFAKDADEWVATKNFVANDRVDKVVSDQQTLGTRVEQVANSDTKTVVGPHTINAASHSIQSTAGAFVKLSLGVTVKGLNITLAGNVVNIA